MAEFQLSPSDKVVIEKLKFMQNEIDRLKHELEMLRKSFDNQCMYWRMGLFEGKPIGRHLSPLPLDVIKLD